MDEKIKERYDHGIEKNAAKKIIKYVEKRITEPIEESVNKRIVEITEFNKAELDLHLKKKLKETISMINKAIEIKIEEQEEKANNELLKLLNMNFSANVTANILINKYGVKNPINDIIEILQNISISNIEKIHLFYDNSNSIDIKFYKKVISCFEIVSNKKEYKNNNYLELFNRTLIDNMYYGINEIQNYIDVNKLDRRIVNKQSFSTDIGDEVIEEEENTVEEKKVEEKKVEEKKVEEKKVEEKKVEEKKVIEEKKVEEKKVVEKKKVKESKVKEEKVNTEIFIQLDTFGGTQKVDLEMAPKINIIDKIDIGDKTLYYYNNMKDWDTVNKTEKIIFEYFLKEENIPDNYFAFPWDKDITINYKVEKPSCFTVMLGNKISNIKYLQLAKDLNITHIFVSHLTELTRINGEELGLKLIPFSICINEENIGSEINNIINRQYLVNYVGNKNKLIREKIFNEFKDKNDDCYIKEIEDKEYTFEIMNNSKFTLCPAGNGVNSIRIWEAMRYGSIPIILSDTLLLPEIGEFNWTDCFMIYNEKDISKLYDELKGIGEDKLNELSNNCIKYYNKYFSNENIQNLVFNYYGF
jgi:hypothetical protein